mgnify:CR=1 FL=1
MFIGLGHKQCMMTPRMRREGIVIFKRRIYEKEAGPSKAAPAGDA